MRRHGLSRPLVLAALCAGAPGALWAVVACLNASPRRCPAAMGRRPNGQYVSDGGCGVWLPLQEEYRNQNWRGWSFHLADLPDVALTACDLRDADLTRADLRGARIWECDLRGADLEFADLAGATYDTFTRWPEGFDPRAHGATLHLPPTGCLDGGVRVWEPASGQLLLAYHVVSQGRAARVLARR